jgi:hypothetical protein
MNPLGHMHLVVVCKPLAVQAERDSVVAALVLAAEMTPAAATDDGFDIVANREQIIPNTLTCFMCDP